MQQNAATPASDRHSRRPTLLLSAVLAVIAGGMFLHTSVFTSVSYEVDIDPPRLYAGSSDSALLRVHGVNRLGGPVPFSQPRSTVGITEGAALLDLEPNSDSTAWVLRPRHRAGIAQLRVRTEHWPFPMLVAVPVTAPMAAHTTHANRIMQ